MKKQVKLLVILLSLICIRVNSQIVVYPNNNVGVKTTTAPTQALEVNGNLKATNYIGNGSQLTNLPGLDTTKTRTANYIYAGPNGSAGKPSFRALTSLDLPTVPWAKLTGTPTTVAGYGITDVASTTKTSYTFTNSNSSVFTISSYAAIVKGGIMYLNIRFTSTTAYTATWTSLGTITSCPTLAAQWYFGLNMTTTSNTEGGAGYITTGGVVYVRLGKSGQEYCFSVAVPI